MIRSMYAAGLVVALFLACLTQGFELPEEAYTHMVGKWNVEIASPCMPKFIHGVVDITNASSTIALEGEALTLTKVPLTQPKTGDGEAVAGDAALSLSGLESLLFTSATPGKAKYAYKVCQTQRNYLQTDKRPLYGIRMKQTQFTEMSGVIVSAGQKNRADPCAAEGAGDVLGEVVIRVVGMPMPETVPGEKDRLQKEAVQYAEVSISTRSLPDSCAASRSEAEGAPSDGAEKKKTRKRRGVRNTVGNSETSTEDAEVAVANGFVIIRLSKNSPPSKTFLEKFYPSLLFAGLFILYRLVYGYFSYRSSK